MVTRKKKKKKKKKTWTHRKGSSIRPALLQKSRPVWGWAFWHEGGRAWVHFFSRSVPHSSRPRARPLQGHSLPHRRKRTSIMNLPFRPQHPRERCHCLRLVFMSSKSVSHKGCTCPEPSLQRKTQFQAFIHLFMLTWRLNMMSTERCHMKRASVWPSLHSRPLEGRLFLSAQKAHFYFFTISSPLIISHTHLTK